MGRILSYEGYGIQTFIYGLLRGVQQIKSSHEIYVFVDPDQSSPLVQMFPEFSVIPLLPKTKGFSGKFIWDHFTVGRACKNLKIDVVLAPAHIRPLYVPCPVVVVVHDMMYHLFPQDWNRSERYYFQTMVSKLTPHADRIVAVSNNTKLDVLRILKIPEEKVEVIYHGIPEGFELVNSSRGQWIREKYDLAKPYILGPGSSHPRKNIIRLIDAFESISDVIPHDLILVGPSLTWKNEKLETRLTESRIKHRIHRIGMVAREELSQLYGEADVFVFPSLYEGFGFPVLEAMTCGCPVITSNVSSLPEVAGNATLLVNPVSVQDISKAILQVLKSDELRADMRRRSLYQASNFSWTNTAQEVLALLEKAAG
jgi:glycosyltransferase involved in cell wall biosynthesis